MKISFWPHGLILGLLVFMAFIIRIIFLFASQDNPLVVDDYYSAELRFEERMTERKNTDELDQKVLLMPLEDKDLMKLTFPGFFLGKQYSGVITFYRPSDQHLDFEIPLSMNEEMVQIIPVANLKPGKWKVRISWVSENVKYYHEQEIII